MMKSVAQGLALAVLACVIPACTPPAKFEGNPPVTLASPEGGTYGSTVTVVLKAYEQAVPYAPHDLPVIYYSLDGNDPSVGGANTISGAGPWAILLPEGTTVLKYFAIDSLDNVEPIRTQTYVVDSTVQQ
jgi:hypothetical protein